MKLLGKMILISFVSLMALSPMASQARAEGPQVLSVPAWFTNDIARSAAWLPQDIKIYGLNSTYQQHWSSFPSDIQSILTQMSIPHWLIALSTSDPAQQAEVFKQFRFMASLAGTQPPSSLAQRVEQLLIFGGAAQIPTPGDAQTGQSLGDEGCTAAMSKYILAQLLLEFPTTLASMPSSLGNIESSVQMKSIFDQLVNEGNSPWFTMRNVPYASLQDSDILPGSLMIGQKPGGTHVFGWTRVPSGWGWTTDDKIAIGNTGLPQFGDRMILAQEYITDDSSEALHNPHGPINSGMVATLPDGGPDLSDPTTNVYAAQGSDFIIIDFN